MPAVNEEGYGISVTLGRHLMDSGVRGLAPAHASQIPWVLLQKPRKERAQARESPDDIKAHPGLCSTAISARSSPPIDRGRPHTSQA